MSCKSGKINPHLVKSQCLPSMFCYFRTPCILLKWLPPLLTHCFSVAVHFSTGHVGRESFNFLKISFPRELLNFEVNFGNIGVLWTWKAQEKKHRVSNQTNKWSPNTATQGNDMSRKISITNVQCHQQLTDLGCCTSLCQTSLGCCAILLEQHILKFALGFLIQCRTCLSKIVNPQINGFLSRLGLHQLSVKRMQ